MDGPYTACARRVIESARAQARAWDHDEVETGHVLLALTSGSEQGIAGAMLQALSLAPEPLRQEVTSAGDRDRRGRPAAGPARRTP
ncbi:Clp protease N-terminal domain-containing protein [Thermomonospora cellulosilytica]|uniref:ATP-dependent Clp protease ATP-binding subunit ClpA n=1 Tax=Thermomonospora cellulosilytica TaxID=1411118 RepID=A0A7W3MYI0_9ACTN|nr:Clp protease N-terminal domain-containing protein [Thermomonospora cellulosilytica]MBA9004240.1 ATP-dependent Clp protease ATP-binding subunit ClpA [Thermomonospora cellulosilytica]